jgi:hypothetical protein
MTDAPPPQFSLFDAEPPLTVATAIDNAPPTGRFSNFVVYVDESGDHGMQTLDPNYPLFVLALCVFHKRHYSETVVPALHKFKFNHFGHDLVVLHEHDIRKEKGAFKFTSRQHKHRFLSELTDIIDTSNFILISCIIDKSKLRARGETDHNPYHLALGFCLEALDELMLEKNQNGALTHVVVECRGNKEDNELELEFRRICDGANRLGKTLAFDIVFASKKVDSPGLQLADLVARPVGMSVLRPGQDNRAFEVLKRKFFCKAVPGGLGEGVDNRGLKLFPTPESEKPR